MTHNYIIGEKDGDKAQMENKIN